MKDPRPLRWRRNAERRRVLTRRMLALGALVGLVGGLLAQLAVADNVDAEISALVRVALVLPAAIFIAWWLLFPGMSLDRDEPEVEAPATSAVEERIERIEAAFDATARPRGRFDEIEGGDAETTELFRRSIRRAASSTADDVARFGFRHEPSSPPRRDER